MGRKASNTVAANDLAVSKVAKMPVAKQAEYKVAGEPGLCLVVQPSGTATYSVRYQVGPTGRKRSRRATIGKHGSQPGGISLKQARVKARELVANAAAMKFEPGSKDNQTLQELFEAFVSGDRKRSERTLTDYRDALERDVFPVLGDQVASTITPKDFAVVLQKVKKRSPDAAHKCRAALGSLFKWAVGELEVEENPVASLGFVHKNTPREVRASDDELAAMWRAVDEVSLTDGMRLLIKVAMLTGQRNSEVAGAEKGELLLDVDNPRWDIPKKRMKRKTADQTVFLPSQAASLLREAVELSEDKAFVFPGTTHGRKPRKGEDRKAHLTQESVSRAFAKVAEKAGCPHIHLHDWRKFMVTWLGERGERPDVLDLMLHHGSQNVTRTHYNHATMEKFARPAWQAWANYLEAVVEKRKGESANIVALRG
jgi:integrase